MTTTRDHNIDLHDLFDETGKCSSLGDPWRGSGNPRIFDAGDVRADAYHWLLDFINSTPTVRPLSDATKIVIAEDFASETHGNYSASTLWR